MQVHAESAPPSPVENLRWLEDQLDVTYSPVCCSYNAGTTTLLLRLPNAACSVGGDCPGSSVADDGTPPEVSGLQREGGSEQNLVDIFGRMQDLEALQHQSRPDCLGASDNVLVDLAMPQGQPCTLPSGPIGSRSQIEESVDSCAEGSPERCESTLSRAEFKQGEEPYSLRNFLNNCLMLPGTRRLSGGRKKKSCAIAGSRLKDQTDASYNRGLQFLQWRGRFPKIASSGSNSTEAETGSGGYAPKDKITGGGYSQRTARWREKDYVRHAGISLRRSKHGSSDSGLANVASTLSLKSLG